MNFFCLKCKKKSTLKSLKYSPCLLLLLFLCLRKGEDLFFILKSIIYSELIFTYYKRYESNFIFSIRINKCPNSFIDLSILSSVHDNGIPDSATIPFQSVCTDFALSLKGSLLHLLWAFPLKSLFSETTSIYI